MATIRSLAIANVKTALQGITVGNGYANTLAGVYVWRPAVGTTVSTPFAVIAAMSEQKDEQSAPYYSCEVAVQIECFTDFPEDDPLTGWDKMQSILADVERAIMVDPYRGQTKNTVTDTLLRSVTIKPWDPDDGLLVGSVTALVRYRHAAGNPSTEPT